MGTRLTQEDVRAVLARAEEIHQAASTDLASTSDAEIVIRAAEEAGLPREAVVKALRERFNLLAEPPKPGDFVFAKSVDGYFSVAEVVELLEGRTRVRFLKGSEHVVPFEDLRPCSLVPGTRVICPWPNWGWWTCTVISYDQDQRKIKVSDGWGSYETFSIADIALEPPKQKRLGSMQRSKLYLYGLLAAGGGLLGSLITWALMAEW